MCSCAVMASVRPPVSWRGEPDDVHHTLTFAPTALIGTVEELAATRSTQSLAREQFEANYYGPVNCIKAVLPTMRKQGGGHIVVLSSISAFPPHFLLTTALVPSFLTNTTF